MTKKTNCLKCGVSILKDTADSNAGLCAPCKGGFRDSIEDGKRRRELEKQYDPFRALWVSLVKRVHAEPSDYDKLSIDERLYFAVNVMDGDIYNGGIEQYFSNSSGDYHSDAVMGLKKLGARRTLDLVTLAQQLLFGDVAIPLQAEDRWKIMKQYPDDESEPIPEWCKEMDQIETEYYTDPDSLGDLLLAYATSKGLVTPFLKPDAG